MYLSVCLQHDRQFRPNCHSKFLGWEKNQSDVSSRQIVSAQKLIGGQVVIVLPAVAIVVDEKRQSAEAQGWTLDLQSLGSCFYQVVFNTRQGRAHAHWQRHRILARAPHQKRLKNTKRKFKNRKFKSCPKSCTPSRVNHHFFHTGENMLTILQRVSLNSRTPKTRDRMQGNFSFVFATLSKLDPWGGWLTWVNPMSF